MDLSNLKPAAGAKHSKKRVGRGQGTGQGVQAGRGHKGAKSRSGFKFKRGFEGGQMPLHRRIPKRGFHNPFRTEYAVVNLDVLAQRFEAGTVITPELLLEARLIHNGRRPIKVLAPRRHLEAADRARAQVQRQGGGEDRGGRRGGGSARHRETRGGSVGLLVRRATETRRHRALLLKVSVSLCLCGRRELWITR